LSERRPSELECLRADLERYLELRPGGPPWPWHRRLKCAIAEEAFWTIYWYRVARWATREFRVPVLSHLVRIVAKLMLRVLRITHGIGIVPSVEAGPGLYFGHFGGVWINPNVKLGKQVSILNGVTIGQGGQGATAGVPTIGDFVYIGPHAVIVSKLKVGNGCVIAANSLVVTDIPDGATAIGVPARVMMKGANPLAAKAAEATETKPQATSVA